MDVDALLSLEKRTGVKNEDIDDFLRKVTEVQDAIQGMKDGKVDPEKVKIEGVETPEEKRKKEEARQLRLAEQRARQAAKQAKQKQEERERWWRGAEYFRQGGEDDEEEENDDGNDGEEPSDTQIQAAKAATVRRRYSLDYSRWESDITDDPASVEEHKEIEAKKEKMEAEAFEKANPDFCNQFKEDQAKRIAAQTKANESANVLRLKGNRFFKAKRYTEALDKYMQSLKEKPYVVPTLGNVSMAHLKLRQWADALEFADRAIYLDGSFVKARSRRATALKMLDRLADAIVEAEAAIRIDPQSKELQQQLAELQAEASDRETERRVKEDVAKEERASREASRQTDEGAASERAKDGIKAQGSGFKRIAIEEGGDSDEERGAEALPVPPTQATASGTPPAVDLKGLSLPSQYEMVDKLLENIMSPVAPNNHQDHDRAAKQAGRLIDQLPRSPADALDALALLLSASQEARVYLRTGKQGDGQAGGLRALCARLCGGGVSKPLEDVGVVTEAEQGGGFDLDEAASLSDQPISSDKQQDACPPHTLAAIEAALRGERKSKGIAVDQGVVHACLAFAQPVGKQAGERDSRRVAALRVLAELLNEEEAAMARRASVTLARDPDCLPTLLACMPNADSALARDVPVLLELAAGLIRDLAIDPACRKHLVKRAGQLTLPLVVCLGGCLAIAPASGAAPSVWAAAREAVVGALANLALAEELRADFALPVVPAGKQPGSRSTSSRNVTTAAAMLGVLGGRRGSDTPASQSFSLAALMNACLEDSLAVKQAAIQAGGLAACLSLLSTGQTTNHQGRQRVGGQDSKQAKSEFETQMRVRAAGLLSRLAGHPDALGMLQHAESLKLLAGALLDNQALGHRLARNNAQGEQADSWWMSERDHLVRIVAIALSGSESRAVVKHLSELRVFEMLLGFLPDAVTEASGTVTSSSVVMPTPKHLRISDRLAGNTVKCLISVYDDPSSPLAKALLEKGLMEKLISLLANTRQMSVRKNVAIVMAKASRDREAMGRMRELRGNEMLMHLAPGIGAA